MNKFANNILILEAALTQVFKQSRTEIGQFMFMLEQAQFSFAMANAHPNVLQAAKYTTKSNDEFGVELVLEKLLDNL